MEIFNERMCSELYTSLLLIKVKYTEKNDIETICYTLKNAGLNTTQRWVKYGRTQWLG